MRGSTATVAPAIDALNSDLLGLSSPVGNAGDSETQKNNGTTDSSSNNDVFTCFLSAQPSTTATTANNGTSTVETKNNANFVSSTDNTKLSLAQEEQDFFNQIPTEKEKAKMTKDNIMALYASAPAINHFNANFSTAPLGVAPQFMPNQMNSMPAAAFGNGPMQYPQAHNVQYAMQPNSFHQLQMQQVQNQQQQHASLGALGSFPQQQSTMMGVGGGGAFAPMQPFGQHPLNSAASLPSTTSSNLNGINNTNLNQQFDNLSLGNVWQ